MSAVSSAGPRLVFIMVQLHPPAQSISLFLWWRCWSLSCWKLNYTEQMASVVPPQTLGPFRSVRASGWTRWNAPDIWLCSNNTHYSRHTLILRKEGVIFVLMVHEGRGLQARILLSRQNLVVAFKIFPIVTPYFINHSFSLEQLESVECAPLNTSECHPYIHMWSFDSGDNI